MKLGLSPPDWSTSSAMNDARPNGRALFDARFIHSPAARMRSGKMFDPRGVVFGGDAMFAASEMADETNAAQASAEKYKIEDNQSAKPGVAVWK